MIQTHSVHKRQNGLETLNPPPISRWSHLVPTIQWVSPQLSRGTEIVRRNPSDQCWIPGVVKLKHLWVRPDVGAVMGNINGKVSQDTDSALTSVLSQGSPLAEEL